MDLYKITSQDTLEQISLHCPRALSTYLICINHADKFGVVRLQDSQMSPSRTIFKNNIKKLALEGLCSYSDIPEGLQIVLVNDD